ncbi:DUF6193 family natural product biosynthesis protein [Streptomyces sp. NPDC058256]|uniref:DUF6193 family natural product biosynthesis protein n=1 Tax=Streptomyces sp. NPDC058256 TaxID=3346408 RepID=UPI0036E2271A
MRTRSEEWQVLLQRYALPQALDSRFTESLAFLIPAAHQNPTFRTLYPVISMRSLAVTDADKIEDSADTLPAIAAMDGVYTVVAWPHSEGTVLFQTNDPAEAVEFAATRIEEQHPR